MTKISEKVERKSFTNAQQLSFLVGSRKDVRYLQSIQTEEMNHELIEVANFQKFTLQLAETKPAYLYPQSSN